MTRRRQGKESERGFALLIVFLMAAAIALMLYQQLPRVAFESQRDKEDTLIDRGEQYKRAIQLYFIEFKKYPAKIEDLENTNNKRFLRHRYIDPMTGKNEWRLVHVNGAGQLTDSLVQKAPAPLDPKTQQNAGTSTTPGQAGNSTATTTTTTGSSSTNPSTGASAPPELNAAALRRPSDRQLVQPGSIPGTNNSSSTDPNDPRNWPPIFLTPAGQQGTNGAPGTPGQPVNTNPGAVPQFPGQQIPGQQFPGQPPNQQFPGQINSAQLPGQALQVQPFPGQPNPGQQFPGQPLPGQDPNQPVSGITGGIQPGQPGANPFPGAPIAFPGQPITPPSASATDPNGQNSTLQPVPAAPQGSNPNGQGAAPNPALAMINNLLTTPRQNPPAQPAAPNAPLNTGGLAGVASNATSPSIKKYKDRSKYSEWEFIFDLKQGLPGQNNQQTPPNQPGSNQAGSNQSGSNQPGSNQSGSSQPSIFQSNPSQPGAGQTSFGPTQQ